MAQKTEQLVKATLEDMPRVAVVPGFISSDIATGETTNLGRGGSDYTAAIIAAAMDAEILEIWTDVDGFMTADPRVIKTAYTINELSYTEAMELCNFEHIQPLVCRHSDKRQDRERPKAY